jgi:hypothetical protein
MEDIMAAPGLDNLHIIEAGPVPANPSELLSTPAMSGFLHSVRDVYDVILVDTPPILPVTDSAIVASQADGVVLVYQAGKVGRLVLKRAKVHVENVGGKVWGVVLNDVKTEIAGYAYTQYYTHYYGEETVVDPGKERLQRVRDFVNNLLHRGPRAEAVAVPDAQHTSARHDAGAYANAAPSHLDDAFDATTAPVPEPEDLDTPALGAFGSPKSKRLVMGAVVVALLAALVGLAGWRLGWFGGHERPKEILRHRLESPAPAPSKAVAAPRSVTPPPGPAPAPASESPVPAMSLGPATAPPAPVEKPVPAERPAPAEKSAPAVTATPKPAPQPSASTGLPASARFAIEFGPFITAPEAEKVERQLSEAGYPTVRFRQQTGAALYAVLVEKQPTARDAQALVATLRQQGFADAFVVGEREPLSVQVGLPLPLRGAVQTAEKLRASGYPVRVAAQPGEAVLFSLRHGNFATLGEAEAKGQELMRLGLGNQVVRVK